MSSERIRTWAQLASYLEGRIQDTPEQKPGRKPDMSPEAGAAMKAALRELVPLGEAEVEVHPRAARLDAAYKLCLNFDAVLKDVTNPSADQNIVGVPLTQLELRRVRCASQDNSDASYCAAKRGLREVALRLLEEKAETPEQAEVRTQVAAYLQGRIQDHAEQRPGRQPDMTTREGEAMKKALRSVSDGSRQSP